MTYIWKHKTSQVTEYKLEKVFRTRLWFAAFRKPTNCICSADHTGPGNSWVQLFLLNFFFFFFFSQFSSSISPSLPPQKGFFSALQLCYLLSGTEITTEIHTSNKCYDGSFFTQEGWSLEEAFVKWFGSIWAPFLPQFSPPNVAG